MNDLKIGIAGILTSLIFIVGYLILFLTNPQTFHELNNISIAAYNFIGMKGRLWSILGYLFVSFFSILFCIGLLTRRDINTLDRIGLFILILAGIFWASFGVIPYQIDTNLAIHLFIIRISTTIFLGLIGLILVGSDFKGNRESRFVKLYSLSTGILILVISLISLFVYNDDTWIRTNISLAMYFIWFGVIGLYYLMNASGNSKKL